MLPAVKTTGLDLKLRRTALRITQQQVAAQMGVRAQFISQIEARAQVKASTASRYLAALEAVATEAA